MFEDAPGASVVAMVRAYEFDDRPVEAGYERIEAIAALERLIRQAQGEQAAQMVELLGERTSMMGIGRGDPMLSVIGEVGMARNIGPSAAASQVSTAEMLSRLPAVFELFKSGAISEPVTRAVTREFASLAESDLIIADGEIAPKLAGLTTIRAGRLAARVVIGIDAEAAHERATRARAGATIQMNPAPDGTAELWIRGPAEQITAAYQTLDAWAAGLRSTGDPRTHGQVMVQTLVERVTGLTTVDDINVEIQLVMDAKTLLAKSNEPVELTGSGPICPDIADDLINRAPTATIRRLLTDPVDGTLIARDPRRRHFTTRQTAFIRARDRYCRQPGCECGIRDGDHIKAHQAGGTTTVGNGQGLCQLSHTIKHLPGWHVRSTGKTTTWTTPTGHTYHSNPPPLLGHLRQ